MLKVTFLTCAIISMPPMFEAAWAGEAVPASAVTPSLIWTGRFSGMAPAVVPSPAPAPAPALGAAVEARMDSDPDIVGSIPVAATQDALQPDKPAQPVLTCPLDFLPGIDKAKQELACGGARHNHWTARLQHFNYDLSTVDQQRLDIYLPRMTATQQIPQ